MLIQKYHGKLLQICTDEIPGEYCSESWGMGAKGFRRAPMMQQKLTMLTRTELDTHHKRRNLTSG